MSALEWVRLLVVAVVAGSVGGVAGYIAAVRNEIAWHKRTLED